MREQGRLGDKARVDLDTHGCLACPHPAVGPAIRGSPDVRVNRRPALRVDDVGIHAACCGANTWTATVGSATVFINGKGAHRMGDQNRHCGGLGQLIEGSPNVIVGEETASGATARAGAASTGPGGAGPAPGSTQPPSLGASQPPGAPVPDTAPPSDAAAADSELSDRQAAMLEAAAASGAPFCRECDRCHQAAL